MSRYFSHLHFSVPFFFYLGGLFGVDFQGIHTLHLLTVKAIILLSVLAKNICYLSLVSAKKSNKLNKCCAVKTHIKVNEFHASKTLIRAIKAIFTPAHF